MTEIAQCRNKVRRREVIVARKGVLKTTVELMEKSSDERMEQLLSVVGMERSEVRGTDLQICMALRQILICQKALRADNRPLSETHMEMFIYLYLIRSGVFPSLLDDTDRADLRSVRVELSSLFQYSLFITDLLTYAHACRDVLFSQTDVLGELTDVTSFFDASDYNSIFTAYAGPKYKRKSTQEKLTNIFGEKAEEAINAMERLKAIILRELKDVFRVDTQKVEKSAKKKVEEKKTSGMANRYAMLLCDE